MNTTLHHHPVPVRTFRVHGRYRVGGVPKYRPREVAGRSLAALEVVLR
jgi:hypothetical protein